LRSADLFKPELNGPRRRRKCEPQDEGFAGEALAEQECAKQQEDYVDDRGRDQCLIKFRSIARRLRFCGFLQLQLDKIERQETFTASIRCIGDNFQYEV